MGEDVYQRLDSSNGHREVGIRAKQLIVCRNDAMLAKYERGGVETLKGFKTYSNAFESAAAALSLVVAMPLCEAIGTIGIIFKESRFLWMMKSVCRVCFLPLSATLTRCGRACGLLVKVNNRPQPKTTTTFDNPERRFRPFPSATGKGIGQQTAASAHYGLQLSNEYGWLSTAQ